MSKMVSLHFFFVRALSGRLAEIYVSSYRLAKKDRWAPHTPDLFPDMQGIDDSHVPYVNVRK